MNSKGLVYLMIITFVGLTACVQKTIKHPKPFNNLFLLYATSEYGFYLPLKIFSENDSLFVQYIQNGKPLDKIHLKFNHYDKKNDNDINTYYFDEIIGGVSTGGIYTIPDFLFDRMDYLEKSIDGVIYYQNGTKSAEYNVNWSLSKDRNDIDFIEGDATNDLYYYYRYEKPIGDLLYFIYSDPQNIESLSDEMCNDNIWTSKDNNFHIYNNVFDIGGNGWGSDYPLEIIQFRDKNNVSAFGKIDWGYENLHLENFIYTLDIEIHTIFLNNKTYYMIDRAMCDRMPMQYYGDKDYEIDKSYYSNGNTLQIYTIENGELIKESLFNTKKEIINNIAIEYDESSDTYRANTNLFKYDKSKKIIYVPLVNGVTLTDKYLYYQWDGQYFTYKGLSNLSWLHESLKDYNSLVEAFETKKFLVRIDMMRNGKYRYASWSKSKTMAEKPDLVIENGIKTCWGEPEIGWCDCDATYDNGANAVLGNRYTFDSGGYIYIYESGWRKGQTINEFFILTHIAVIA